MANVDPYKALGVERSASAEEIKKAYRKLARQHHPDNSGGDERKFKEIQGAYDILSDPEKKKTFDRGGFQMPGGPDANFSMSDLADLLGGVFGGRIPGGMPGGGGRRQPIAARGRDVESQTRISFEQSIRGTELSLPVPSHDPCPDCRGTGGRPGSAMTTCPECSGQGVIIQRDGLFSTQTPCPRCHGAGRVPKEPCTTCRGTGLRPGGGKVRVKVPAGIRDGARIRVAGRGEPGSGSGPAGDLFVVIHVDPSPVFARKGDALEVDVPINVAEALQGGEIRVPTLDGTKLLRLAPGTKHGSVQRLKGQGAPRTGGGRGDLHYRVMIDVPKELTEEQRQLVKELAATFTEDPRASLLARAAKETNAAVGADG